jgi:hypothetical protein
VIYARAEARAAAEHDESGADAPEADDLRPSGRSAVEEWAARQRREAAQTEAHLARYAVPGMLLLWFILVQADLGRFFARTFFGMWLHELGHAAAAWLCGIAAIPGPWFTSVDADRSFLFALALIGGLGWAAWRTWTDEKRLAFAVAVGVLALELVCTLLVSLRAAHVFIFFAGDAGCLVFGALLMAAFFVPPEHKFHRDWLRWGFLVIGAAGFADTFDEWWKARSDYTRIPFGEFERGGPSDPSALVEAGWAVSAIVHRYIAVGLVSLAALVPLQILHLRRTQAALEEAEAPASRRGR